MLVGAGVLPGTVPVTPAHAAVGQGFSLNAADLRFILKQIRIAERHAGTPIDPADPCAGLLGPGADQIPNSVGQGAELPWGLRTVDGTCNNLMPGQSDFGGAGRMFPRRAAANFRQAEAAPPTFPAGNGGPGAPSSYSVPTGFVYDSQPRVASNLIVDQTASNPSAVAAAGVPEGTTPPPGETLFIPNVAPDVGLSAPYNSMFTLFGQFFDHGLDLVGKRGGTVFVPLREDDPLYVPGAQTNFMVLSRATTAAGPDGVANTPDDDEATNKTSPYVDQSQTYTSHPSHQAFLREYTDNAAVEPVATGRMLTGPGDGLATWADVKTQAAAELGIALTDADIFAVPLLATDPYGSLMLSAAGKPQFVTATGLVEASPGAAVPVPTDAVRTGHSFLDDIAHNAVPKPAQPAQGTRPAVPALTPDADSVITGAQGVQPAGTYDDEMLDAHFVAGDGRINENIGLTAVHHVFHSEHNRLVGNINDLLTGQGQAVLDEWQTTAGPAGWDYGERLFQAARFVTEMEYQHLAFEEFARKVQPQVNLFAGYDTSIDAAISAEFAHAVYRFGHSMLTESVDRRTAAGTARNIDLLDAFLNPPAFYDAGIEPEAATGDIVRGMTAQVGNEIDEFVTEALRSNLLGLPLDLATLNMARARETGVPSLNEARRTFFELTNGNSALAPYENWIDFGLGLRHHESLINFVAAYGTHPDIVSATTTAEKRRLATLIVAGNTEDPATPAGSVEFMQGNGGLEDVDLWVGGLAEKQAPFGGLLGSTFNFIFETEMEDLQDGDRLYYLERTAGLNLLVQLEGNSFAELISRNTDAENLPADVFSRPDLVFDLSKQATSGPIVDDPATEGYNESTLLSRMVDGTIRYAGSLHVLFIGTANPDRMRSSEGDDTLRGNEVNDRLEGGAGNDQLIGGLGEDVLTDAFGDDVLKGGDGHDAMASGAGFDLNQGGLGDDFVVGGSDPTETFGGPGDDMIFGGDSSDTVFGDDGDDWLEGGGQADVVQGDNGAPFQDDPNTPGHDVLNGNGGLDDYHAEGGDDIMVSGPGIELNEGMLGFDWVTHKNDAQAANDDLAVSGFLPPSVGALRDRFDLVEALSGGNLDDILRGDNAVGTDMVGHELDAAGITRVAGLAALLPAGATSFTGGNIIIGGEGNDLIEGRGGNDLIDGDVWLNVQLQAPNRTPVDSMSALQADVFAGRLNPGDISIVRSIVSSAAGSFVDTAVFSGPRADYDVSVNGNSLIVTHARGTAVDGTDILRNIEQARFADQTIPVVTAPDSPTITSVVPGNAQATVSFTAPADDGNSPITEFRVEVLTGTTVVRTVTGIAPTATSTVVTGLTNGTPYTFRVQAVNAVGAGPLSAPSSTVTPTAPPTVPAAPAIGSATAGDTSATVRWTVPADGGSAITSYRVQVRTGTTVVRTVMGIAPTATSTVVTGLTNGTSYTFRVRAVNAVGLGALSAPSNAVTPTAPPTAPAAPAIGTASPRNASATVRWTVPADGGSAITGHQIQVLTGTTVVRTVTGIAPTATSTIVTGLTNGTPYTFRVQAVNAVGAGALSATSNTVTPGTLPGRPTGVSAQPGAPGGDLTASVSWVAPTDTGGVPITGYVVRALRMSADGQVLATTTSAVQSSTTRSLSMTLRAGNYQFTVRAVNDIGSGAFSSRSNLVAAG